MGKYFLLQLKRIIRIFPLVLAVVLVLYCGLMVVFNSVMQMLSDDEEQSKFEIALVGDPGDTYLNMGVTALQSFDTSRFAIDILKMDEQEAMKALEKGDIGAYVVIPPGFIEEAIQGQISPLKYVSTLGATGIVSMFKDEITAVIADIVLACQRGMYGIEDAFEAVEYYTNWGEYINSVSLSYAEFVLIRSKTYQIDELGIIDDLGMEGYLFCGICVLFLSLAMLPFGYLYIKRDLSFEKILVSKKYGVISQVLCEFLAFFTSVSLLIGLTFILLSVGLDLIKLDMSWLLGNLSMGSVLELIPVLLMISAFAYMLFILSDDLVGGILLSFFVGIGMCFISGCMYPLYFFPQSVQKLASTLPHSLAREYFSGIVTGDRPESDAYGLLMYSLSFVIISAFVRKQRLRCSRG